MDFLRNLPTQQPQQLTQLIQIQPGRVVSMAMSRQEHCQMTLLAFGDGENDLTMLVHAGIGVAMGTASDEVKRQADYILEGALFVSAGEDSRCLQTGDCLAVPAHTPHAVVAPDGCKLLQITLS